VASKYAGFQVILDDPAATPLLGYQDYARAFADLIRHSRPQFAIGIFGEWGSGKTTLMREIERRLSSDRNIVGVWFNAWRYEREEHLIVPLLDSLREALVEWAARRRGAEERSLGRRVASAAGKAGGAILSGLTLRARLPLIGLEAGYDVGEALAAYGRSDPPPEQPLSFYHLSFNAMRDAIEEFTAGGVRRVVVFVDDLDRCLPLAALEVLESMKLFFDTEGFIFVVGLDQAVIERSIELKYQTAASTVLVVDSGSGRLDARQDGGDAIARPEPRRAPELATAPGAATGTPIQGADYIKKIFQVPFSLPRIATTQINTFFDQLIGSVGLPREQQDDVRRQVKPHLRFLSGEGAVNPREVKRLINGYTIQMKMLSSRLGQRLEPGVVLALLTMNFRSEWRRVYEFLVADPATVRTALSQAVEHPGQGHAALWPTAEAIPPDLISYVRTAGRALLTTPDLEPYISSVESSQSADPGLREAQGIIMSLGRAASSIAETGEVGGVLGDFHSRLERLRKEVRRPTPVASELMAKASALSQSLQTITPSAPLQDRQSWGREAERTLRAMYEDLRELRALASVGGHS
jgi:hypothetical protein